MDCRLFSVIAIQKPVAASRRHLSGCQRHHLPPPPVFRTTPSRPRAARRARTGPDTTRANLTSMVNGRGPSGFARQRTSASLRWLRREPFSD